MSYKTYTFYQDILITEVFYVATKNKKAFKHEVLGKNTICIWTQKDKAETFLSKEEIDYDEIKALDIDKFVTYELDDIFKEGDEVLVNPLSTNDGELVDIINSTNELMSDLDNIRLKEFNNAVIATDEVYGLTSKNKKEFILISDEEHEKPNIMPVWSSREDAKRVRDEDFEECDIIEVEGEVFAEWLDELRDDDKAVAVDLKPGVIGTVVSAQKLIDKITF